MTSTDERLEDVEAGVDAIWDLDVGTGRVWRSQWQGVDAERVAPVEGLDWFTSRVHPDDLPRLLKTFDEALAGRALEWRCEYRFRNVRGEWARVRDHAHVRRDEAGRALRVVGVVTDITAAERQRSELEQRHALYEHTLATVEDVVWATDLNSRSLYASAAAQRVWGRPSRDFLDDPDLWFELIHPDDRERVATSREDLLRTGWWRLRYRIVRPDGEVRWLDDRARVTLRPDGTPARIDGVARDVTDLVRAEQRERAEREVLELVARGAPVSDVLDFLCRIVEQQHPGTLAAVLLLDPAGRRLQTGAAPGLPAAYADAIDEVEIGPGSGSCGQSVYTGRTVIVEDMATDPRWCAFCYVAREAGLGSSWSSPITTGDGRVVGTFVIYHRRRRRPSDEELALVVRLATIAGVAIGRRDMENELMLSSRMASVGTLAAGVAHEINNPLAFVLGNLGYLRDTLGDLRGVLAGVPAARELDDALADCVEGARRIQAIVRDLRTFSHEGRDGVGPIDLARTVQVAVRMVTNEIKHRARLEVDADEALTVIADEARLGQVLVNLLVNAAQAMPDRPAEENRVSLTVRRDGPRVTIDIADNGAGIAAEHLPRIFDPFFSTRRHGGGRGLGLSVVHTLVTGMGGAIDVRSRLGEGAVFRLHLPAADAPLEAQGDVAAPVTMAGARSSVLVVDDEAKIATILRRVLERRYDVVSFTEARDALAWLQTGGRADAAIFDLMMPGMSGMDLFDEIERRDPALAERTGFLTGGAFTPRAIEFAARHAWRTMEKPFTADGVFGLVDALLRPPSP